MFLNATSRKLTNLYVVIHIAYYGNALENKLPLQMLCILVHIKQIEQEQLVQISRMFVSPYIFYT